MSRRLSSLYWDDSAEPLFTIKELARYLKVAPLSVYKMIWSGKLPAFKVSDWRIRRSDVIALIERNDNQRYRR